MVMKKNNRNKQLFFSGYLICIFISCQKENVMEEINAYEKYLADFNSGKLDSSAFIITQDRGSIYYSYYSGSAVYNEIEYPLYYYSLCKYDLYDRLVWKYTYGDSEEDNDLHKVIQIADGSILFTGYRCKPDLSNNVHALAKLSKNGKVLWERTYDGLGINYLGPVYQTSDEGFVIVGMVELSEENDWIIIKTNRDGTLEWSKTYGEQSIVDCPQSIIQTDDNGYLVTVLVDDNYDTIEQINRVVKLDPYGSIINTSDSPSGIQYCNDIIEANDNGYILAVPYFHFQPETLILHLFKISTAGDVVWTKEHNMEPNVSLEVRIMELPDTGYFFMDRYSFLKLNNSGDLIE
jgi:hypothetical protein